MSDQPAGPSAPPAEDRGGNGGGIDFSGMRVQEMMRLYYSRLFPYQEMYRWLAYGNDSKHPQADGAFFQRREFCFTLDGDIFVRYQSFKDAAELGAALKDRVPAKIDIGPVYTVDPQRRAAYQAGAGFNPVERELVFDIDLTDYDDVRTCGKEGHICNRCWPLMAAAIKILDAGLREDFGFKHLLWVYSGRRGVHCWVCDERARKLTDEQRSAIASYFAVYKGQEKGVARLSLGLDDHPSISRAADVLRDAFDERVLPGQGLLEDGVQQEAILAYLPSEELRERVRRRWAVGGSARGEGEDVSVRRWHVLLDEVKSEQAGLERAGKQANRGMEAGRQVKALEKAVHEIIFAYTYPRLDMEVSKKMNHLLKAPFCVHPKTGKVCVPIDPEAAWEFDPDAVTTVASLLTQLNAARSGAQGGEDWSATDMAAAVATFRSCFLDALQAEAKDSLSVRAREAAAAPSLAW